MAIIDHPYRKKATMIEMEEFLTKLKECMEAHQKRLRNGRIILPQYLEGGSLEPAFKPVARCLARTFNLRSQKLSNQFLTEYDCGLQIVDFAFMKKDNTPVLFLELESLDGSQLFHFFEHRNITNKDNYNKLWYYYGTLGNYYTADLRVPKYFVWLICLPDRQVEPYHKNLWDFKPAYRFFDPSLKCLVYENPYRFYDRLIKTSALRFVKNERRFLDRTTRSWIQKDCRISQDVCELVFITWTGDRLIMSRGKDLFDVNKEKSVALNWRK